MEILKVENLTKTYGKGDNLVRAVDNISFSQLSRLYLGEDG